jgi:hypothetical protein
MAKYLLQRVQHLQESIRYGQCADVHTEVEQDHVLRGPQRVRAIFVKGPFHYIWVHLVCTF